MMIERISPRLLKGRQDKFLMIELISHHFVTKEQLRNLYILSGVEECFDAFRQEYC